MSRPKNPSWTVLPFAPDVNYGAGALPWQGHPTKTPWAGAASVGFTPKMEVPAQALNYLFNSAFDQNAKTLATLSELLDYLGQTQAFSFRSSVNVFAGTNMIKFCPATLTFYGTGQTLGFGQLVRTKDLRVWPNSNEIGSALHSFDGAFDVSTAGKIVMPGNGTSDGVSAKVYDGASWSTVASVFSPAFIAPDVVYEPVSGLWCVAGKQDGVAALNVYTSPNTAAWTVRTAPTVPSTGSATGPHCRLATDGAGVIVMQAFKDNFPGAFTSDAVSFSRSTDGGVTWSAADVHNITWSLTGGNEMLSRPVWTGSAWVAVMCNNATKETYVYSSPTGATFTQVAHLTACAITSLASIGELVIGYTKDKNGDDGRVAISVDNGATWHYTDEFVGRSSTLAQICMAGTRLVLVDPAGKLYFSSGMGEGVSTVT